MSIKTLTILLLVCSMFFAATHILADDLPAPNAAARPLPDFVKKVQLQNCGGVEVSEDGAGVMLYRLPRDVRDQMTEKNKDSKNTGADMARKALSSEIRFVLNAGEKPENVKLHLQSATDFSVSYFWGDIDSGEAREPGDGKEKVLNLYGHGLLYSLMNQIPAGRFPTALCRVVISGGEVIFKGIDGDVRPPRPEELPPVMMSYGTSITEGYAATRADLAWNSLTARFLGDDLVNLGCSGTAYCEPAVADYMAKQPWNLCVLEISVNMVGDYTTEEFRQRATYMINTLAKSHPQAPVVCIGIFPWGIGDYWKGMTVYDRTREYRQALEEILQGLRVSERAFRQRHRSAEFFRLEPRYAASFRSG